MNEITAFADRLCLTLLHSLWEAAAIFLLVSAIMRLASARAEIGYAAWMSGLDGCGALYASDIRDCFADV